MTKKHFKACNTLTELKLKYKELCKLHHPDKGGDLATMQSINAEYDFILASKNFTFDNDKQSDGFSFEDEQAYKDIIQDMVKFEGLNIELCGSWLWFTGLTYPIKTVLKELGCKFSKNKCAWYWYPGERSNYKTNKTFSFDYIRNTYGSIQITGINPSLQLN